MEIESFLLKYGFVQSGFSMGEYEVETLSRDDYTYSKASFGDERYIIDDASFDRELFISQVKLNFSLK